MIPERRALIPGTLLLTLLLRLPSALCDYPVGNPDEIYLLRGALSSMLGGDPNPHIFEYPAGVAWTLFWALHRFIYQVGHLLGIYPDIQQYIRQMNEHPWAYSVPCRLVILFVGILGIPALHRIALRLSSPKTALWAATAFALTIPFAHRLIFDLLDSAIVTLLLWSIEIAMDVVEGKKDGMRFALLGALLGTATNAKIPYLLSFVLVPVALIAASTPENPIPPTNTQLSRHFAFFLLLGGGLIFRLTLPWSVDAALMRSARLGAEAFLFLKKNVGMVGLGLAGIGGLAICVTAFRRWLNWAANSPPLRRAVLAGVLAFLFWSPFYLADLQKTMSDLMIVMRNVDAESIGPRPLTWHATILRRSGTELLGPILGLLGLVGIGVAVIRRNRKDLVILVIPAIWFAYTGFAGYSKLNLMYVFAPFVALYAARLTEGLPEKGRTALMAVALVMPFVAIIQTDIKSYEMPRRDTRIQMTAWYRAHFPAGVLVAQDPEILIVDDANPGVYQVPLRNRAPTFFTQYGIRYVAVSDHVSLNGNFQAWLSSHGHQLVSFRPGPGIGGPGVEFWELKPER